MLHLSGIVLCASPEIKELGGSVDVLGHKEGWYGCQRIKQCDGRDDTQSIS